MPNRFGPGCQCCGEGGGDPLAPCCGLGETAATTLYVDWSYAIASGCSGGPTTQATTTALAYDASYSFPFAGVTGRAWVGCEVQVHQEGPPFSPGPSCVSSPAWLVLTDDSSVLSHYGFGGSCAILILYQPYDKNLCSVESATFCRVNIPCSTSPGDSAYGWLTGVVANYQVADATCSPSFALADAAYPIDESP